VLIVTGATGLLGNTLVREALGRGLETAALARRTSAREPLADMPIRLIEADLASDPLETLVSGATIVIHAAARVGIGRRDLAGYRRDNALATRRLAAACTAAGARFVHISTVDTLVWGTRESPGDETQSAPHGLDTAYAVSKREAEDAVAAEALRGLDAVILHPGFLLGPWDWKPSSGRMLLAAARAPAAFAPPGGNDFCHAGDVASAVLEAALKAAPGSRYVLSGEALTYAEAFRLMRRVAGRPARIATAPSWLIGAAGLAGDAWGRVSGQEPALNSASAAVACVAHHFSSAKAMRDLGYRPRPAEAAIRDAWTWFVERGYA
jgi:dihydroflavonol-4-reductase